MVGGVAGDDGGVDPAPDGRVHRVRKAAVHFDQVFRGIVQVGEMSDPDIHRTPHACEAAPSAPSTSAASAAASSHSSSEASTRERPPALRFHPTPHLFRANASKRPRSMPKASTTPRMASTSSIPPPVVGAAAAVADVQQRGDIDRGLHLDQPYLGPHAPALLVDVRNLALDLRDVERR